MRSIHVKHLREWVQRLLMPAFLLCVGLLHDRAGDYHMASGYGLRKSQRFLEQARNRHPDAEWLYDFEQVTERLATSQLANFRLSTGLLLMFVVFSLAWLAVGREPLRFRALVFVALWLGSFALIVTGSVY